MINLFEPSITPKEIEEMSQVLNSHWIGKGSRVTQFEQAWAAHLKASPEQMVSTNSCTQALFEAVKLANVVPGDEVILPTIHFVGALQAILAYGATPVLCDVNPVTLNADHDDLVSRITPRTKAILLNSYGGILPEIRYGEIHPSISIIQDLAQAPHKTHVRADFACWSFDAMKILTCGDGGMLYCREEAHATQARQDFSLGTNVGSGISNPSSSAWWEFNVEFPGQGRHLMNDLAASLGLVQLARLPDLIAHREKLHARYASYEIVKRLALSLESHAPYFFWISTENRDALATYLRTQNIYTSFRYYPLHWAYPFSPPVSLPKAEHVAKHNLLLPFHNQLTLEQVDYVCAHLEKFFMSNPHA